MRVKESKVIQKELIKLYHWLIFIFGLMNSMIKFHLNNWTWIIPNTALDINKI